MLNSDAVHRRSFLEQLTLGATGAAMALSVGAPLQALGHKVESIDGGAVGGYQAILFTPDANAPAAAGGTPLPIQGFYRAGSDHRKDGQAAGY